MSRLRRAACHCDSVVMRCEHPPEVFECNCSICSKLGVLWAYYTRDAVTFERGENTTGVYTWNQNWIEFHTCRRCGCTTHWLPTDPDIRERMGVNARLIEGVDRRNTVLKHFEGGEHPFWTRHG